MRGKPLVLDPFQVEAMAAVDRGENVLVAALTGAGKPWSPNMPSPGL